jgi:nucleoside-diphosphate-sugar epimerase
VPKPLPTRVARRILVTGVAAYTGLALARSLAGRGYSVRASSASRIKASELEQAGVEVVTGHWIPDPPTVQLLLLCNDGS